MRYYDAGGIINERAAVGRSAGAALDSPFLRSLRNVFDAPVNLIARGVEGSITVGAQVVEAIKEIGTSPPAITSGGSGALAIGGSSVFNGEEIVVTGRPNDEAGFAYNIPLNFYDKPTDLEIARANGLSFFQDPFDTRSGPQRQKDLFDIITQGHPLSRGPEVKTKPIDEDRPSSLVTINDLGFALLSEEVYDPSVRRVGNLFAVTNEELEALKLKPSDFVNEKSGFKSRLFRNADSTSYFLAFAGTDGLDLADIKVDIANEAGRLSSQHKQAVNLADHLVKEGLNIAFTGHSLGGGLASLAAATTGRQATTFNAAGISDEVLAFHKLDRNNIKGIRAFSHRSDPLGNYQDFRALQQPLGRNIDIGTPFNRLITPIPLGAPGFLHGIGHTINAIKKAL